MCVAVVEPQVTSKSIHCAIIQSENGSTITFGLDNLFNFIKCTYCYVPQSDRLTFDCTVSEIISHMNTQPCR